MSPEVRVFAPCRGWCGQDVHCQPGAIRAEEADRNIILLFSHELVFHKSRDPSGSREGINTQISKPGGEGGANSSSVAFPSSLLLVAAVSFLACQPLTQQPPPPPL